MVIRTEYRGQRYSMGSSDPLPAGFEIRFGSLNFQATGNDYLMRLTNREELRARRQAGSVPVAAARVAATPTPTCASRGRRGEPRARQAALPNCGTLHLAWRLLELAHLLTASTQPPPRRSTRHRGCHRPVPPRELAGATTAPTKGRNRA
jgi:hypothetical protein